MLLVSALGIYAAYHEKHIALKHFARFALVAAAGELLTGLGITGWAEGEAELRSELEACVG